MSLSAVATVRAVLRRGGGGMRPERPAAGGKSAPAFRVQYGRQVECEKAVFEGTAGQINRRDFDATRVILKQHQRGAFCHLRRQMQPQKRRLARTPRLPLGRPAPQITRSTIACWCSAVETQPICEENPPEQWAQGASQSSAVQSERYAHLVPSAWTKKFQPRSMRRDKAGHTIIRWPELRTLIHVPTFR